MAVAAACQLEFVDRVEKCSHSWLRRDCQGLRFTLGAQEGAGESLGCKAVKHIFSSCARGTFPLWCERKARLHRVSSLDYVVGIRHCQYFIKFFQQNKENYSKKIRHSNINTRPNEEESAGLSHTSMHTQQQRPDWFPYLALVRLRGAAAFVALWVCVGRRGVCAQVGLRGQASTVLLTPW